MKLKISINVVIGVCLMAKTVFADNFVVPATFATTEAGSSDNAPLGANEQHFQQVFSSLLLTNLNVGDYINGIGFRVEGNESELPTQVISTYNIGLGQSLYAPGSLSSVFSDNRGADFLTVRSGALTVNPGDFPGGSLANDFGWITLTTPYQYQGGDLLIEIAYQGFSLGRNTDAAYPYTSGLAQTAFGTGFSSTTADAGIYDEALVMGFSRVENISPVPEPSPSLMFGAGFSLLFFINALRKNRHS